MSTNTAKSKHSREDNADRPQGNTTGAIVQVSTAPQVSFREDGSIVGLESDEEDDNDSQGNHVMESQGMQGSEHQDEGEAHADP